MPEHQAPAAVAVVVAFDPGPWFEDCLRSLVDQDYPNASLLVIDNASAEPLAARVAAAAPEAYVLRLEEGRGYGAAANVVLEIVENAAFYLFCHDDVFLAPDALRRLVEEAFRENAGIVAPKLLDAADPSRLLQVGLGLDRLGVPVRRVERGELDQGQHDEAREVFAAPGACTLVRADLFQVIGGFDPEITLFGEDTDLCWRARLAGARVRVEPAAAVRHLEATATRLRARPDARVLRRRHEIRAVLKNYGPARRRLAVAQLVVVTAIEVAYFFLRANGERWRELLAAWRWNLAPERRPPRAGVPRRVPDRVVARLFSHRESRLWRLARPHLPAVLRGGPEPFERHLAELRPAADRLASWARLAGAQGVAALGLHPGWVRAVPVPAHRPAAPVRPRWVAPVAAAAGLVALVGSREILFGATPLIGGLLPIPGGGTLLGEFFGGWRDAGMQSPGPATPAFALLGVLAGVFTGAHGLLLNLEQLAGALLGAFGAARLLRPVAPPSARLVAGVVYVFLPLLANDLAVGDVTALAAYAGMPWILARLVRADVAVARSASRPAWRDALALGVVCAVVGAFAPAALLLTLVAALGLVAGAVLGAAWRSALRLASVAGGGVLVAFVLLLPWSLTYLQRGARLSALLGVVAPAGRTPSLAALLRFATGPVGHGFVSWAPLAAAAVALAVGRAERLAWATRWWLSALGAVAFAFAAGEGWLGGGGGATALLLAPAAAAVAAAIGLGAAAIVEDLPGARLGWRHALGVAAGVCALAGLFPVLARVPGGAWGRPSTGYDTVLSVPVPAGAGAGRVLWLGDPAALPLPGWQVRRGFSLAVSTGALPDARRLALSANPGQATAIAAAIASAEAGDTVRLGHLLAPERITAIVVPTAAAPVLGTLQQATPAPPPEDLLAALLAQADLHELPRQGGALVFENTAWHDGAALTPAGGTPAPLHALAVAAEIACWLAVGGLLRVRRWRRPAPEGQGPAGGEVADAADTPPLVPPAEPAPALAPAAPGALS